MKSKIFLLMLLFPVFSWAQEFALEGGFRQQNGDIDGGVSSKPVTGYQVGGLAYFPMSSELYFRTGLFYTQRTLKGSTSTADLEYKMNYVDLPLTVFYKFSDYGGIFGGAILSNNFEKSWSSDGSSLAENDVKSIVVPLVVGASFKFLPQVGASAYYEVMSSEVARGLKNYRAVGVNLAFYFE